MPFGQLWSEEDELHHVGLGDLGGMGLLFPLFHIGVLVVTRWDPNGLPDPYPVGCRHYTGQKSRCCHPKKQETRETTSKVCACVTKLSLNNASFQRTVQTQRCGAWDTCKQRDKAQSSKCKYQHKSLKLFQVGDARGGMVHESTKRPS